MVELYLNNQLCDLYGNETIATDYSIAPINNIASRNSAKSISFKIPLTANNRAIIESANVIVNETVLPYRLIPAQLKCNGLPQNIEFAQIKSIQEDIIIALFGSNVDFFGIIKSKKLSDLTRVFDHDWTLANAYGSRNNTDGYIYAMIDFHADSPNAYIDDITPQIDVRGLLPSVFLHSVVNQIIEDAGFTASGDFLSDPNYRSIIIPTNPLNGKDVRLTTSFVFTAGDTLGLNEIVPLLATVDNSGLLLKAGSTVIIQKNDYTQKVVLEVLEDIELPTGTKADQLLTVRSIVGLNYYAGTSFGDPASVYYLTIGDDYTISLDLIVSNQNPTGGIDATFGFVYATGYPLETDLITVRIGRDFGSRITSSSLPDLKQSDLLKDTAQKFGLIFQVDNNNKIVYIRQFSEIVQNKANAIDWSEKVDYSEKPETDFDSDYAQSNLCTYKDDDTVKKPPGTDSKILVDNENLPPEKELFESPFAACEQVDRFGGVSIAQIKLFTDLGGAEEETANIEPRYLIKRDASFSPIFTYTDGTNTNTSATVPVTHFIIPTETFNAGFENNLLDNSADLIEMIQRFKDVVILLRLTASDINQLDFFIPVWIALRGQPGCYYYISTIKQFKSTSKESTDVELVKLP